MYQMGMGWDLFRKKNNLMFDFANWQFVELIEIKIKQKVHPPAVKWLRNPTWT